MKKFLALLLTSLIFSAAQEKPVLNGTNSAEKSVVALRHNESQLVNDKKAGKELVQEIAEVEKIAKVKRRNLLRQVIIGGYEDAILQLVSPVQQKKYLV